MRNYDVTFIFSPLLEESSLNDTLSKLASFVQEKGGILGNQHIKGKRPLLAPIGKHKEGFLATLSFSLVPEHLEAFEKYCKEQKDILRFLAAKHIRHATKAQPTIARPHPTPVLSAAAPETPASLTEAKSEEKIDLEDIDKKLEEIFKET
ncbi:MAG TPA: 30S ribosomal protein S6 [Candidatus Paceibacterota bacterium]